MRCKYHIQSFVNEECGISKDREREREIERERWTKLCTPHHRNVQLNCANHCKVENSEGIFQCSMPYLTWWLGGAGRQRQPNFLLWLIFLGKLKLCGIVNPFRHIIWWRMLSRGCVVHAALITIDAISSSLDVVVVF